MSSQSSSSKEMSEGLLWTWTGTGSGVGTEVVGWQEDEEEGVESRNDLEYDAGGADADTKGARWTWKFVAGMDVAIAGALAGSSAPKNGDGAGRFIRSAA